MKTVLLLFFTFVFSASSLNDARKANDAYRSGDYERAVQLYQQAIENNPDDARLHFNLGSALAQLGRAEESVRAFETSKQLMDNPQQQAMADYNAGTLLSEAEMYDEAIEFFRDALRKNPHDADTKHNYEMSLRKQQKEEEQNQDQQDQESDEDDQEQDQEQQQDQEQEQDQENEQEPDQNEDQGEGSPDDQDPRDHELPQPDEISRDEAENILNALEQLEREILENRKKEATEPRSSNDKDW